MVKKRPSYNIFLICIALAFLFWVFDAILDSYAFGTGSFFESWILNPTPQESYMRIVIVLCFIGAGYVVSRVFVTRQKVEDKLYVATQKLGERVRELGCLYGISRLVEKPGISLAEIYQGTVDLIPPAMQYPDITSAKITLDNAEYTTGNYSPTEWYIDSDIYIDKMKAGKVIICYLAERPEMDEGPFMSEERNLLAAIAERLGSITGQYSARQRTLAYQERLRDLAMELTRLEERERRRLATEIHDSIGQALSLSKIRIGALRENLPDEELAKPLDEIRELIEQCISDTRTLTFELSPPILYDLGFVPAVEWLAEQFERKHGLAIAVYAEEIKIELDNNIRIFLFQAVRELLYNVVKHANASSVTIRIKGISDRLEIEVEDDGVGMDEKSDELEVSAPQGFGLFSIRERAVNIGGEFNLETEPGEWTRVKLSIPEAGGLKGEIR